MTQDRTSRAFEHAAAPNGDAAALSIGITQRVIGPLAELSMAAAKENARLATELQVVALEAIQESLRLCHRGCLDALDSAQRALLFMATTARLVTQSADRLQTAATDAGRRVRESLEDGTGLRESARG